MIFLKVYVLSALIFAIAMCIEAIKSEHFKMQENGERFTGLVAVFILSLVMYPMMIAAELEYIDVNRTDYYENESK